MIPGMKRPNLTKLITSFTLLLTQGYGMASPATHDLCDISRLYTDAYSYSLPQKILEGYLSGTGFPDSVAYTQEESQRLREDIQEIAQNILGANPVKENVAIMTAGAPGAGKTLQLRQDLAAKAAEGKRYAYIDPDDVCLKSQPRTYGAEIAAGDGSKSARQDAYNKWRAGSNAANHLILGNLIREKYGFYFGTTSSGPQVGKFFEFLKAQGYKIRLIHVSAPDEVHWGSIQERDKTFVQTTEQDVKEKGFLLPQRINDAFLKYADEIEFYQRNGVHENAILAATWVRNAKDSDKLGTLHVVDQKEYAKIKAIHNAAVKVLGRPDLEWERAVESTSKMSVPAV